MKNGDYILIKAPKEYPGKRYRNNYCYEHQYVWWKNTKELVNKEFIVHHKNRNKQDNSFSNLELKTRKEHNREHISPKVLNKYKCEFCKKEFKRRKNGMKPRFCSRKCIGLYNFPKKKFIKSNPSTTGFIN